MTETANNVSIDVGSSGPNQVWDFRSGDFQFKTNDVQFLSPQQTPFAADFPEANFVRRIRIPEDDFTALLYSDITEPTFNSVGFAFLGADTTIGGEERQFAPLPIEFNNSWMRTESDTVPDPDDPDGQLVFTNTTTNVIDARGTVRTPAGDFECVRMRTDGETIQQTISDGG